LAAFVECGSPSLMLDIGEDEILEDVEQHSKPNSKRNIII